MEESLKGFSFLLYRPILTHSTQFTSKLEEIIENWDDELNW